MAGNDNHNKDYSDNCASQLKNALNDLKDVKQKQEQVDKMNRINMFLKKIHGDKEKNTQEVIQNSFKQAIHFQEKLNYLNQESFLTRLWKAPYYKLRYGANLLEAKHYEVYDFFRSAFYALFFAITIRSFLLQPFSIPSESMLPTLVVGDYIFVNKMAYGYSNYSLPFAPDLFEGRIFATPAKRGDVVVFRVLEDDNKDYIKRIVGVGGDRIQYKGGRLWVNGKAVSAQYNGAYKEQPMDYNAYMTPIFKEKLGGKEYNTLDVYRDSPLDDTEVFTVPEGHYFVSGDNRDNSQDSRIIGGAVGFVPEERLIGKAEYIFFSLDRASFLEFWKWPSSIRFNRIFKKII